MNPIGGYFELELPNFSEYHRNAIRLNTGRNALEYILRVREYKRIFIPYFTCDVLLQPIRKLGLQFEFYRIDDNLEAMFNFEKSGGCFFIYKLFRIKIGLYNEANKSDC